MIITEKKKRDAVELEDGALDRVSGGAIIPGTGTGAPEFIPATVIDDNTLKVIGQTDTAEAAVKMARSLGVSTERITQLEFENARKQRGIIG